MTEFECILDQPISSAWPVASDWLCRFAHCSALGGALPPAAAPPSGAPSAAAR